MCDNHITTNALPSAKKLIKHPMRLDPTGTVFIQRKFMVAILKHLQKLNGAIYDLIVKQDAFELLPAKAPDFGLPVMNVFDFTTDASKVAAFREWLKGQVASGILLVDPANRNTPWLADYIFSAYKKASVDAYSKIYAARQGTSKADTRSREAFLQSAFNTGTRTNQIELLYTRSFELLNGITADMSSKLNTILADGISHGKNPKEIAKNITKSIEGISKNRAATLARTEVINAYTEGTLDTYEEMAVQKVVLFAEWITAGDDRVCPKCAAMNAAVITLKEARGLIPFHPNCRCAWLPLIDENSGRKSRAASRKRKLEKAKAKARKAGAVFPEDD